MRTFFRLFLEGPRKQGRCGGGESRGRAKRATLEAAPPSQDSITLEKSTKARCLRQHARRACYPGEKPGTSVRRSGTSNTEHPTSNEEERRAVTRGRRRGRRGAEE